MASAVIIARESFPRENILYISSNQLITSSVVMARLRHMTGVRERFSDMRGSLMQ